MELPMLITSGNQADGYVSRLAYKGCPTVIVTTDNSDRLAIIDKMMCQCGFAVKKLKHVINMSGYLLTLTVSLALWYGIFSLFSVNLPDPQQIYTKEQIVNEKVDSEELDRHVISTINNKY